MSAVNRFMLLSLLLVVSLVASVHSASAYTPIQGDSFHYSETITVNNGQGAYTGYTEQTQVTGNEQVNSVSGSAVYAYYSYTSHFSNNQGGSSTNSSSGYYTWSSSNFTYLTGTDNQVGYAKPTYVWFAMNPSLPVGGTFYVLNTQFTVLSKNYSFPLVANGTSYIQTIQAKGTGQYPRNDDYGVFTASYTWNEYFDPTTGYIVGYNYVEQDTGCWTDPSNPGAGCQSASFTYTENLYVTSTSYTLTPGTAPSTGLLGLDPFLIILLLVGILLLIIIVIVIIVLARRRRRQPLPQHSIPPYQPPPPSTAPWESKVDMGSKPSQQVVIKEVAMVNCKYCRNLIPSTVERCPYCDGPRE